tara:strand:+ start:5822 stop:6856 length:1035 start_codon:yes stop_codon:yes gene_type:complete
MTFPEFELENGCVLREVPVAYKTWGKLNPEATNVIVVCHSLTSNCDVEDWWSPLIGPGKALDTTDYFIVCANAIGSPYGTASPVTVDPQTGVIYGITFPIPSIRDTVNLHKKLLSALGVKKIAFPVGGSMGGMQVLEWAFHKDFVSALAPIGVGGRHSPWCIGWSEAQRQAIYSDPSWKDGSYSQEKAPSDGLSIARMIAMISYRSFGSFNEKFGRKIQTENQEKNYAVESYLRHQGNKLVSRFDANCYIRLTQSMDTHDVARGRGDYFSVLSEISQPSLVIGIDTDILYPLVEQKELLSHMPDARLEVLESEHGHDGFLIETEAVNEIIATWRKEVVEPLISN